MAVMRHLTVDGTTYDTVGEASVTQVQSSGTKIATVTIDGTATDIYAPSSSGPSPSSTAPAMDGTAAVGTSTDYARADHVHPTDTSRADANAIEGAKFSSSMVSTWVVGGTTLIAGIEGAYNLANGKQATLVSGTNIKTINSTSLLGSGDIAINGLPSVTAADNGKVLRVVNGVWAAASLPSASGVSF